MSDNYAALLGKLDEALSAAHLALSDEAALATFIAGWVDDFGLGDEVCYALDVKAAERKLAERQRDGTRASSVTRAPAST